MGTKEDESNIGYIWAAGYHHVMLRSRLAHVLKLMKCLFLKFSNFFFSGCGKTWITETADTESADTGAQLYVYIQLNATLFLTEYIYIRLLYFIYLLDV